MAAWRKKQGGFEVWCCRMVMAMDELDKWFWVAMAALLLLLMFLFRGYFG